MCPAAAADSDVRYDRRMRFFPRYWSLAVAPFILGCGVLDSSAPGPAERIVLIRGNDQTGVAGQMLPGPIEVEAQDAKGRPVPRARIDWDWNGGMYENAPCGAILGDSLSRLGRVPEGPASDLSFTRSNGRASVFWTLGRKLGSCERLARLLGSEFNSFLDSLPLRAQATSGAPATLAIVRGLSQVGSAGSPLPDTLVALVRDQNDLPVSGAPVQWRTESGSIAALSTTTNTDGTARAVWTLGPGAGTATARMQSVTVTAYASTTAPRFRVVADADRMVCAGGIAGGIWCWGEISGAAAFPAVVTASVPCLGPTSGPAPPPCRPSPVRVAAAPVFAQMIVTPQTGCGLDEGGTLWCWGYTAVADPSAAGCVAVTGGFRCDAPQVVTRATRFTQLAPATDRGLCALSAAGAVWCWGSSPGGATLTVTPPTLVAMPNPVVRLGSDIVRTLAGSSPYKAFAIEENGTVYRILAASSSSPGPSGSMARLIAIGGAFLGTNDYSTTECRVAPGATISASCTHARISACRGNCAPTPAGFTLSPGGVVRSVAAGAFARGACALGESGAVHCETADSPALSLRATGPYRMLGGVRCMLHQDETVRCRGTNLYGELGVGVMAGESHGLAVVR